jgi:hypothetical protein
MPPFPLSHVVAVTERVRAGIIKGKVSETLACRATATTRDPFNSPTRRQSISHFSNNNLRRFHHNKPCILALAYMYSMTRKDYTDALPHHTTIRQYRCYYTNESEILEPKSYVAQTRGAQSSNADGNFDRPTDSNPHVVYSSDFC